MWDYKYGRYTVGERWNQMLGIDTPSFFQWCRVATLAFAVFTMRDPQVSYYISPQIWLIMFLAWYWYPS